MTLSQYFICFIIYSFLGWVYESLFYTFQFKRPVNTGFLHGCICPIYGLACIANVVVLGNVRNNALIFIISMLMISVIEYVVSYTLEYIFDKRWWDYSDWPLNLNGRISIISSLGFGTMSLIQIKLIHPLVSDVVMAIPINTIKIIILLFCIAILFDLWFTVREMDKSDEKLWFIDEESETARHASEKFEAKMKKFSTRYANVKDRIRQTFNR